MRARTSFLAPTTIILVLVGALLVGSGFASGTKRLALDPSAPSPGRTAQTASGDRRRGRDLRPRRERRRLRGTWG